MERKRIWKEREYGRKEGGDGKKSEIEEKGRRLRIEEGKIYRRKQ